MWLRLRTIAIVSIIVALLAASGARPRAEDWPRWRGPRLDGISRETGLLKVWPKGGPRQLWRITLSGGFSAVTVAGGSVFAQTKEGNQEVVISLDAATGKELWRHRYDADYSAHPTFTGDPRPETRTGPRATPAVDEDRVYVMGATGILLCLEAKTGNKIWQRNMLKPGGPHPISQGPNPGFLPGEVPGHGVSSSPLVVGGRVYVVPGGAAGETMAALDKKDGRVIWRSLDEPVGHSSPIWADVGGSPQIIFLTGISVVGLAPQDGRLLWRYPWKTTFDLNIATPVYGNGQVFVSSNYGKGGAVLRLTNKAEPEKVWESQSMQNHITTSVLYEGHLYGFSTSRLRCVEFQTGKLVWDKLGLGMGNVLVADGNLIILGEHGELVLAKATPTSYTEISSFQLFDKKTLTWTVPILSGGRLFVRHENGLVALDLKPQRNESAQ